MGKIRFQHDDVDQRPSQRQSGEENGTREKSLKKRKPKPFLDKKESKNIQKEKRARLVIRNLPFKATEENIRKHFGEYGDILNVNILKRPDGKLVGCAFVQFKIVQFAKQAKHYTHNQPFLGRNIDVDFAQSKKKFEKEKHKKRQEDKAQEKIKTDTETKEEKDHAMEIEDDEEKPTIMKNEEQVPDSDDLGDDNIEDEQIKEQTEITAFHSHDVNEGKTIFIKNVPFQATNEDLKKCMAQFGRCYYALICVDKLTEHSKGTAFVKFLNKEDADMALQAGTELTLLGNVLDCHPAIDRNDLKNKERQQKEEKSKPKDSRNLYLVKEGVILAGTKAAEGVSASDMAKRLQIEQYKTEMLRNLNTFVARDRLVVHNLPPTWDDRKLRILSEKHGGPNAVVREARIMRNMNKVDAKGVGESKQFGFVAFTRHEHALAALRSLNNNPNIFSAQKRPIICFSIENKSALKAKVKRQEKSRMKNPKSKDYDPSLVEKCEEIDGGVEEDVKPYAGVTAKQGTVQKMRSRYKLSQQAKIHHETLKKEKMKKKMSKKSLNEKKKDFIKQPKQKINNKKHDDNFSKMVESYKKKVIGGLKAAKKSKWYEAK